MPGSVLTQWLRLGADPQPAEAQRDPLGPVLNSPRCPHCQAHTPMWPAAIDFEGGPLVCSFCAGWAGTVGEPLELCPRCAHPHARQEVATCRQATGADEQSKTRILETVAAQFRMHQPQAGLTRYLERVHDQIGLTTPATVLFADTGDPVIAALDSHTLIVGLGLLAALEDEAQLAFVLAREAALSRVGWPQRRFRSAAARGAGWWQRWWGKDAPALVYALQLSMRLGFGAAAEAAADREALTVISTAQYDSAAAARALRRLERAALAGRNARFLLAADRATWLEDAARRLVTPSAANLNREVYRRAIGGFSVFAHS